MPKATIVQNYGDSSYRVKLEYDTSWADDRIAGLDKQIIDNVQPILDVQVELQEKQEAIDDIDHEVNLLIIQKAPHEEIVEKVNQWYRLDAERQGIEAKLKRLQMQDAAAKREKTRLETNNSGFNAYPEFTANCADFTTDIDAGTDVEVSLVPGENAGATINIYPGHDGAHVYDPEKHGALTPPHSMSSEAFFWNYAQLAGWQRWQPTFRHAVVRTVDRENNTADITLEEARSSVTRYLGSVGYTKGLNVNQFSINDGAYEIDGVPIQYMTCNAAVFEAGDRVLVDFRKEGGGVGATAWGDPIIIGFVDGAKPCLLSAGFRFALAEGGTSGLGSYANVEPERHFLLFGEREQQWKYRLQTDEQSASTAQFSDGFYSNIAWLFTGSGNISTAIYADGKKITDAPGDVLGAAYHQGPDNNYLLYAVTNPAPYIMHLHSAPINMLDMSVGSWTTIAVSPLLSNEFEQRIDGTYEDINAVLCPWAFNFENVGQAVQVKTVSILRNIAARSPGPDWGATPGCWSVGYAGEQRICEWNVTSNNWTLWYNLHNIAADGERGTMGKCDMRQGTGDGLRTSPYIKNDPQDNYQGDGDGSPPLASGAPGSGASWFYGTTGKAWESLSSGSYTDTGNGDVHNTQNWRRWLGHTYTDVVYRDELVAGAPDAIPPDENYIGEGGARKFLYVYYKNNVLWCCSVDYQGQGALLQFHRQYKGGFYEVQTTSAVNGTPAQPSDDPPQGHGGANFVRGDWYNYTVEEDSTDYNDWRQGNAVYWNHDYTPGTPGEPDEYIEDRLDISVGAVMIHHRVDRNMLTACQPHAFNANIGERDGADPDKTFDASKIELNHPDEWVIPIYPFRPQVAARKYRSLVAGFRGQAADDIWAMGPGPYIYNYNQQNFGSKFFTNTPWYVFTRAESKTAPVFVAGMEIEGTGNGDIVTPYFRVYAGDELAHETKLAPVPATTSAWGNLDNWLTDPNATFVNNGIIGSNPRIDAILCAAHWYSNTGGGNILDEQFVWLSSYGDPDDLFSYRHLTRGVYAFIRVIDLP